MKKVLSIFLALLMILSICTVGVSASDYVWIYTSRKGAQIDNYLYFPVYYDDDSYYSGDAGAKVRITLPCFYHPEILKPVEVTPSELLYGMNFTSEISKVGVYTDTSDPDAEITYPYFYADITFDGDTKIEKGEVLFNVKMEIIGDPEAYNGIYYFDHFFIVEDLEQEKMTCCKWEVIDVDGNVIHDISSKIWQNVPMDLDDPDTNYILEGYEPFIPPVEEDEVITVAPTLQHVRKGNLAYYPIKFDLIDNSLPADYAKLCKLLGINAVNTHIRLGYTYAKDTLELINVFPSKGLYNLDGSVKIVEQGVSQENPEENYFIVEIDFTDAQGLVDEYLFNLQFEVLKEEFFYPDAPNIARTLVDTYPVYADYENLVFKDCLWEVTDSKGTVHDLSDRISTQYITMDDGFFDSDYNDLLITDYDPYVPYSSSSGGLVPGMKLYSGSTYYIRTVEDLLIFMDLVSMGHAENEPIIMLENDIVINYGTFSLDENNEPLYVGKPITEKTKITRTETSGKFGGTFEGNGHVIVGLYSTESGLFDAVCSGKIQNLAIRNSLFDFRGNSSESAGAICSTLEGSSKMIEVVFNGIILNDGENTGGLAGEVLGNSGLVNCRNLGRVIGADYCGGLVGKFSGSGDMLNCINKGSVESTGDYVGGIVASVTTDVNLKKCANPGIVMSTGNYVGGIVGELTLDSNTMNACCHTGTVSGNDYVGGLVGKFYTPGDNLEEAFIQFHQIESQIDMYEKLFVGGDGIITHEYPPTWAVENDLVYLFEEREQCLDYISTANTRNLLYSYSAGDVTANGEYLGALFGEFSGCVWRCLNTYYNSEKHLPSSGKDTFMITMLKASYQTGENYMNLAEPGVASKTGDAMKTEAFAETMSAGNYHYMVDENNENNGYIIHTLPMASDPELGNTDITQKIHEFYIGSWIPELFAADETKRYKFDYALDGGNHKVTVEADERAAVRIKVYKNGTLVDEGFVVKADTTALLPPDTEQYENYEYIIENYVATDEIILEITDCTSLVVDDEITMDFVQSYCTPSAIYIDCETIVPEVEEKPLFEFGVTAPHIRNKFDMLYYPASFGFSMYDDADIRYSDICADVADLAFGCDTEVVMKYIYDATTLDFISVYEDFWEGSVEVLEHGSTGETGPDGQEYNYIIIKAKFSAVGYANDTAPYCLKFAVVEDNFINSDGTIRKVIDNVPYSEDQLCVWKAWDAKGNSFDFSDSIKFKSSDYETDGYTYDNLLLEDDLIDTDIAMPTVTFTPEHARKDDLAYYPCMYDSDVDYEEWVRSATGFKDSTTRIQIKVNYDSSTLELIDALPSKELYDLGGTVTIIETGDLYPDDPDNANVKYAVVQIDFDALDFTDGCLFSLKFRVLQENFLDEEGRPIDLVNSFVADWVVTSNEGKSHDLRYYVSSSYASFESFGSYEELILADYEPFDPTLLSDVTEVTYIQQEDTHKTFTVTVNGRKAMIQFIEPDGGTRTYDRYNKNVKITSYNADGEVVSSMARDLAYEVWEIYSNMSVGVEIQVRGKENYKWDEVKYRFTIEPYNPIISMELSAISGKKGPVPATVVADEKTEKVMFKMPNNSSVTVSNFTTDENGNRVFTGKAWMNEDGLNEIRVYIRRDNVWRQVGTLEYTVE